MTDMVVVEGTPRDIVAAKMPAFLDMLETDPDSAAAEIVDRILASSSPEAALLRQETVGGRKLVGRSLRLRGFKLQESQYEQGPTVYAVLDVMDKASGEVLVVTCGALQVLAQLYQLNKFGALPIDVKFQEPDRPTRRGFKPLWLVPDDDR